MTGEIIEIETRRIYPNLRLVYKHEAIDELCRFILDGGELTPLDVWFDGEGFRIIDGEKRWRACAKLNITRIKVRLIQWSEQSGVQ